MQASVTINGVDFTPHLREGGLIYGWTYRLTRAVVTMDGTLHQRQVEKRTLTLGLRAMRDAIARPLVEALKANPATVSYTERDGTTRERLFYITKEPATVSRVEGGNTWYRGADIVLEEM